MTLPDTVKDLNPSSTKEWLMMMNVKLDNSLESQNEDRETIVSYIDKMDKWITCHEQDKLADEKRISTLVEKVDSIEKRVNNWNLVNSIGVIVSAVMGFFGLKGS